MKSAEFAHALAFLSMQAAPEFLTTHKHRRIYRKLRSEDENGNLDAPERIRLK
jgi:hypothetical protein